MTVDTKESEPRHERRKLQRLNSKESFVTSTAGEFELLNLSPTGLAVQGQAVNSLVAGQRHVFVISDRGQTFEVAGEVRWTRFDDTGSGRGRAGIAFLEVLQAEPNGMWSAVSSRRDK